VLERSLAIAEHRIRGIHGAVERGAGQTEHEKERQRRRVRIGQVLGHRFDSAGGNLIGIEICRRAADQMPGQRAARPGQIAAGQKTRNLQCRGKQVPEGEQEPQRGADHERLRRTRVRGEPGHAPTRRGGDRGGRERQRRAADEQSGGRADAEPAPSGNDEPAEPGNGVKPIDGIADGDVETDGNKDGEDLRGRGGCSHPPAGSCRASVASPQPVPERELLPARLA
jgi:hypothetical protein